MKQSPSQSALWQSIEILCSDNIIHCGLRHCLPDMTFFVIYDEVEDFYGVNVDE